MSKSVLIKGGRVIDPAAGVDGKKDVLVGGGVVKAVEDGIKDAKVKVVEAEDCLVLPGFVDLHAHFRDPGHRDEETIASGSAAAVKGGFTTVCVMPNTEPAMDNEAVVRYVMQEGEKAGLGRILPVAAATEGRKGGKPTEMHRLKQAGAAAVSDDGNCISPASTMRIVLEYAGDAGLVVMDHPEDTSLSEEGVMHEGRVSDLLGIPAIPAEAEVTAIERDIALAGLTGGRLHLCHVSTAGGVEALARAKKKGLAVTGEVAPHHLLLSDELMERFETVYKVSPPLRSQEHIEALLEGLRSGVIDAIATDHAPHRAEEKELDLLEAPFGMASIECAWSALYTRLVLEKRLELAALVERLTAGPARVLGMDDIGTLRPGAKGDVAIVEPEASEIIEPPYASLSQNCPYAGWEVKGAVRCTVYGGRVVYERTRK